ncbi:hypoxanthine phosphoribosyltransferase [Amorphoplanes digitatis]|uniref:Hypoxanthine phosphoribosyltransferase n=1 Tax=Actinoplanes digitatis TaxID=1868 RepID=A0A7W7HWX9_9ACTN|nr:hypoxanthine phosphoribosyltransferase [Actinoplanes digitatis]MBB4762302.1 hypoxanthine phosphoribosyltransferase [Actinoplanes digitatis]GID92576.1 hypoxanthine phosphoribosyltransferase [Actinoplanes digitatis]
MDADHVADDLESVLLTEDQILARVGELAAEIGKDMSGREIVLIGVLGGAATFTVDLARALESQVEIGWMAIRSYTTTSNRASGSVRQLKDLDIDIEGRDVIIAETVIDTGLTMSWLISNLNQRRPASIAVCALLRKPDAPQLAVPAYIGFDVPSGQIVGYGLDYRGRYRNLRCAAVLASHAVR